jgi:hypothetical protein
MVEAETMAAARAAAKAAGLWAPAADWPPGAPAVGGARLRWVAPRWRLRRRAGVPQAAPAAGDLRWCLRRAVSGGSSCGERASGGPPPAAGEPTHRTAAGGAFGGRARQRRRYSLPPSAHTAGGRGEAGAWRGGRAAAVVVASGLVVSIVGRRTCWRAPRRERKRIHSTPPSLDDDGVE